MKSFIILGCVVALSLAAPATKSAAARLRELPALRHEEVHDEFGQYSLRYVTAENTVVSERGHLIPAENGTYVLAIDGQYQYVGDDGKTYVTKYHAGPEGFQVEGDHLPQPVPMPAI